MKKRMFVLLAAFVMGGAAMADEEPDYDASASWICSASGYDMQGNRRSVFGDYRATEVAAEQSALAYCSMQGLGACQVSSCFQL